MSFEQHLDQGLSQAKRHGWGLAVLFIDIDKFKSINDSYGHGLGDKVLLMMANRLRSFVREEDLVSRWGGDEFVCLLMEVKQEADVTRLAEKMVNQIAAACEFDGIVLSTSARSVLPSIPQMEKRLTSFSRMPIRQCLRLRELRRELYCSANALDRSVTSVNLKSM